MRVVVRSAVIGHKTKDAEGKAYRVPTIRPMGSRNLLDLLAVFMIYSALDQLVAKRCQDGLRAAVDVKLLKKVVRMGFDRRARYAKPVAYFC